MQDRYVWIAAVATLLLAGELTAAPRKTTKPCLRCNIPWADYQYRTRSRPEMALSKTAVLIRKNTIDVVNTPPAAAPAIKEVVTNRNVTVNTVTNYDANGNITSRQTTETTESNAQPALPPFSALVPVPGTQPPGQPFPMLMPIPGAQLPVQKTLINLYQLDRPSLTIDYCSISRVALQLLNNGTWTLSLRADQNPRDETGEPLLELPDRLTLHIKRNQFFIKIRCYGSYAVDESTADASTGKPVLLELGPKAFWVQNGQPYDYFHRCFHEDLAKYFAYIDRVEIEFYYR